MKDVFKAESADLVMDEMCRVKEEKGPDGY